MSDTPNTGPAAAGPIPDEAARLLAEVEAANPAQAGPDAAPVPELSEAESVEIANVCVEMLAGSVESLHPALRFDSATRAKVAAAAAPVVKKYDGALPPWLMKWKEELMLAFVLAGVSYGAVRAVREYKPEAAPEAARVAAA